MILSLPEREAHLFPLPRTISGGMLYRPPKVLVGLCSPLPPLIYNMLWLWRLPIGPSGAPAVHTLVIGAARPSDFDEAVRATKLLDEIERGGSEAALMEAAEKRMSQASREVWGEDWADDWWLGLPDCYQNLCGVHVAQIVWMWAITKVGLASLSRQGLVCLVLGLLTFRLGLSMQTCC